MIALMNSDSRDCSHFYKLSYYKFKNIEGRKQNADSLKMSRFLKDSPYQNFFLLLKVIGIFRPLPHNGICRLLRLLTSLLDTGRAPTLPKLELASSTFRKNIANGWIRNSTQRCSHYKIIVMRFSVIITLNIKITEAVILGSNGFLSSSEKISRSNGWIF